MRDIVLTFVMLVGDHKVELVREMPNMTICKQAMQILEPFDEIIELTCQERPFE